MRVGRGWTGVGRGWTGVGAGLVGGRELIDRVGLPGIMSAMRAGQRRWRRAARVTPTPSKPPTNRRTTAFQLPADSRPTRAGSRRPDATDTGQTTAGRATPLANRRGSAVGGRRGRQGGVGRELGRELDGSWAGVGRELGGRVARGLASRVGPPGMSAMRVGQCRWSRVGASDPAPTPGQPPSQLPVIPYAVYAVYAVSLPQRHTSEP